MYPLDSENQSFTIAAVLTFVRRFVSFLGDRLHKSSAVAEMGDRLDTIDIGRKCWGSAPFCGGGTGSAWAEAYLRTKRKLDTSPVWPQETWAKNWGGCAPSLRGSWVLI